MKVLRILIPMLLLLTAVPSFAIFQCGYCDTTGTCVHQAGNHNQCGYNWDTCYDQANATSCFTEPTAPPVLFAADYTIASVEVVTPAKHVVTTTEPRLAERTLRPVAHSR